MAKRKSLRIFSVVASNMSAFVLEILSCLHCEIIQVS